MGRGHGLYNYNKKRYVINMPTKPKQKKPQTIKMFGRICNVSDIGKNTRNMKSRESLFSSKLVRNSKSKNYTNSQPPSLANHDSEGAGIRSI